MTIPISAELVQSTPVVTATIAQRGPTGPSGITGVTETGKEVVTKDTAQQITDLLNIKSAAFHSDTDFAPAEQGQQGATAFHWGDHRTAGYLTPETGRLLLNLPPPYSVVDTTAITIANSVAKTAIATWELGPELVVDNYEVVNLEVDGDYTNNTGSTAGFILMIEVDGVTVLSDSIGTVSANANPRLLVVELALQRLSASTARIIGNLVLGQGRTATAGRSELSSTDARSCYLMADNPVTLDWTTGATVTISVTLDSASATHTLASSFRQVYVGHAVGQASIVTPPPVPVPVTTRDWIEDQPTLRTPTYTATGIGSIGDNLWPKTETGSLKQYPSAGQLAAFDTASCKSFSEDSIAAAQAINSRLSYLRIYCPQDCQRDGALDTKTGNGYPFVTSGASTTGTSIFAGHWLYAPRTTLTSAISSTGTGATFTVASTTNLAVGRWVCIYTGSFANPEHCKISAISGNTITLSTRGFASTSRTHASGEYIAMHMMGNGGAGLEYNWVYNLSTACPTDGAGKKANEAFATWIANNYDLDQNGAAMNARCDGILYDSDFYINEEGGSAAARACDCDNDGVVDYGFSPTGINLWGEGLDAFYANVRAALNARGHTNAILLGGDWKSAGQDSNNGAQMETFPDSNYNESGAYPTTYPDMDAQISAQKFQMIGSYYPRVLQNQNKSATEEYGAKVDNRPMRLAIALGLMFGGSASSQNGYGEAFRWWDEYAVDTTPGANYGKAVLKTDLSGIYAHSHWLGAPLGAYRRIYDPAVFAAANALYNSDTSLSGWASGANCIVSESTEDSYTATSSLKVTVTGSFERHSSSAYILGPTLNLSAGKVYTVCFAIKAPKATVIRPRVGSLNGTGIQLRIPAGIWSKQIQTLRPTAGVSAALRFDCGQTAGPFFLDQMMVFEGDVGVFRRDFENGIALANATPNPVDIDLGGSYRKILGTQDPGNDGSTVTSITLSAYDGILLVNAP